jgi:hypothetical protein
LSDEPPSSTPAEARFGPPGRRAASRSAVSAPHLVTLPEAIRAVNFFGEPVVEEFRLRVSRERLSRDLPPLLNLQETAWALCINRWTVRNLLVRRKLRGRQVISGQFIIWRVEAPDVRRWAEAREAAYARRHPWWDFG